MNKVETERTEPWRKPFRRGKDRKNVIVDANGHYVFSLNKGQYPDHTIDLILQSINNGPN